MPCNFLQKHRQELKPVPIESPRSQLSIGAGYLSVSAIHQLALGLSYPWALEVEYEQSYRTYTKTNVNI